MSQIKLSTSLYSLVLVLVLSGCGFEPMYRQSQDSSTLSKLQNVKVDVIANRSGQILRNYLLDTMTESSRPENEYVLKVTLTESVKKLGFRLDKTPRHEEITIKAVLKLENAATGKIEYTDTLTEVASFSLGPLAQTASYSASVAEDSSREKALKILAENINLYVSGYLLSKGQVSSENCSQ